MVIQLKNIFIVKRNEYINLALLESVALSTLQKGKKKSTCQDQLVSAIVFRHFTLVAEQTYSGETGS